MASVSNFTDFDEGLLSGLTDVQAVSVFRSLLWCAAKRSGLPSSRVTVPTRVDVADGGIDAEVDARGGKSVEAPLARGRSYYQIKGGTTAAPWQKAWVRRELCGARPVSRAALGDSVRHALASRAKYTIACFGVELIGRNRSRARANLKELFKQCGFPQARVDVWGRSEIAGMIRDFPSLRLRLSGNHGLPFLTWDEWRIEPGMGHDLQSGDGQKELVKAVRESLRSGTRHVRIVGEPGLGKSRLSLEACADEDLAALVIYCRRPDALLGSSLFNQLLRADADEWAIVVVDDCPGRDAKAIWGQMRGRGNRLRLVSLDHEDGFSNDSETKVITCPPLAETEVLAILKAYVSSEIDLSRWADFCSASPRVAHAVGENLKSHPEDVFREPSDVPMWDRFIRSNEDAGPEEIRRREISLRCISLFERFGFEDPVSAEAAFVAELAGAIDPSITWQSFQSVVEHYRNRRVIQGAHTLCPVPPLLHFYLFAQFWQHHGRDIDLHDLLSRMPSTLHRWFSRMFRYGHASRVCRTGIERMVAPSGPVNDPTFLTTPLGANLFNDMAEASPEAVVNYVLRMLHKLSRQELLARSTGRQLLVWALEKIAVWPEHFDKAAEALLILAAAEVGKNSNNATGTFAGLFGQGFGRMGQTQAAPPQRHAALRDALQSTDPNIRSVARKGLRCALSQEPAGRIIGPEHQGLRPEIQFWMPKTWGEVFASYREAIALAASHWRSSIEVERAEVEKILGDEGFGLLQMRSVDTSVLPILREIAAGPPAK